MVILLAERGHYTTIETIQQKCFIHVNFELHRMTLTYINHYKVKASLYKPSTQRIHVPTQPKTNAEHATLVLIN